MTGEDGFSFLALRVNLRTFFSSFRRSTLIASSKMERRKSDGRWIGLQLEEAVAVPRRRSRSSMYAYLSSSSFSLPHQRRLGSSSCLFAERRRWNPRSRLEPLGDITRHQRGFDLRCGGHGSSTRRKRRRRERLCLCMWREWGRRGGEMERGDKGCDKKSVHLVSLFERRGGWEGRVGLPTTTVLMMK